VTGFHGRWGKTEQDDPQFSPFGPEILDIEISVNGCKGAGGKICKMCSPAGTKVNTPNGEKNIENIRGSDVVFGGTGLQTVVETYARDYEGDLVEIELENGKILRLTPDHKVFLKNGSQICAGELTENMELSEIG